LQDTVIGNHVKIDDHVHIAHNCVISDNVIITACAELSGGVEVGRGAWIAPNCAVLQKTRIGDDAFVGIGAAVIQDVKASARVFGYPAKLLPKAPE
jgi:UDP-3-O-[3-hydroxymyristoyl] glucosamine N-acyltransferase